MAREPYADLATLALIRRWITEGINLDLVSAPAVIDHVNTFAVEQNASAVRQRIAEYIDFEALTRLPADAPCPFGVQPLHVIIKAGKKPRLVIDLSRNLNDHLAYEHFTYATVLDAVERAFPGCWFGKLDLSNCFLSFPLHPCALPHFIFRFEGQLYQFLRMPFGLSTAPRICTLLLSVVGYGLLQAGVDASARYLDDFLFQEPTESAMERSLRQAEAVIAAYGLVVNPEKTEGPSQRITFLGIVLDSVQQTLSCTPERLQELRSLLHEAEQRPAIKLTALETLIGKLSFATQVLPGARPFMRRMMDLLHGRLRSLALTDRSDPRHRHFARHAANVRVDRGFRADARFWLRHLHQWDGSQRWRSARSAPFTFASDASLEGFGFYLESVPPHAAPATWPAPLRPGAGFSGAYSSEDAQHHAESGHMTWCELFAVFAALHTYRHVLRNSSVLFILDNSSDVHALNRQSTGSRRNAGLLREIYSIAVASNIAIAAEHRPGVDNVLADFLSRPSLHGHSDIVGTWQRSHPDEAARLVSVSHVHSRDFGGTRARPS